MEMVNREPVFRETEHQADFCVVGGGMAGFCAALAAARHGATVVLMHDRPVLGGNASSEMRVHICGADHGAAVPHMRETGILEEVRLENLYRNPQQSFSIWDTVLYEAIHYHPNITLLLNCSCLDAEMDGSTIVSVTGWQLTTQTYHKVNAKIFADCSGDAILAPLTGAEYRVGREGRDEYGESIAPEEADKRTMGMTCLFHAKEYDSQQPYEPPSWANQYADESEIPGGANRHHWWKMGYWWVELGGEHDSIHDTEYLRDELLKIVFGLWDHIKNRGDHGADNWGLEWVQFLPAKRESRRYIGDYVLTQIDVEAEGRFDDIVAYGGWPMDDHHPAGFRAAKLGFPATIFHHAPSPFGIPYGTLYSRNIDNLMFAGRCASCTHAAMSSTRVAGTGSVMGQAAGTAAALAIQKGISAREVKKYMKQLQQALLADDCYLPWVTKEISGLTAKSELVASQGDPEPIRDGIARQVGEDLHCWIARVGDSVEYLFDAPKTVAEASLVLDSAMESVIQMSYHCNNGQWTTVPDVVPKRFRLEGLVNDKWETVTAVEKNRQRHVRIPINKELTGLRFVLEETWGAEESRVYEFSIR